MCERMLVMRDGRVAQDSYQTAENILVTEEA
jgi:hypothetical protein